MQATGRPEFLPPHEGGLPRSFALALLAHALLVAGLSWGVRWNSSEPTIAVEAEIWSPTVQQAAPKAVEAPPPPPPPRAAPAPPPPPINRDAEIALEREKLKAAQDKAKREEAEKQKLAAQKLAEKKREDEAARRKEEERKLADAKKKDQQAKARNERDADKMREDLRKQALDRMLGQAGATGARDATGTAARSSGPSSTYAGKLAAHFLRHVVFPGGVESIAGNPVAEIQVKVSPSGFILSAKLLRSSGNREWDEAAVRAIERSEKIPPDVDGRYVTDFTVGMRPKPAS